MKKMSRFNIERKMQKMADHMVEADIKAQNEIFELKARVDALEKK